MTNLEIPDVPLAPGFPAAASVGTLKIMITSSLGLLPIQGALVRVSFTGDSGQTIDTLTTDESGQTKVISIPAPNVSLSLAPDQPQPYAQVSVSVTVPDYETALVDGIQILPGELALQTIRLRPLFLPETSDRESAIFSGYLPVRVHLYTRLTFLHIPCIFPPLVFSKFIDDFLYGLLWCWIIHSTRIFEVEHFFF